MLKKIGYYCSLVNGSVYLNFRLVLSKIEITALFLLVCVLGHQ